MSHAFSSQQSTIFETRRHEQPWRVNEDWTDLYALLAVPENAHPREIDEAIVGRSAECLQYAFARGGGSEFIATIERYLPDFRRVLLHERQRARYDELLHLHRLGMPAPSYAKFLASLPPDNTAAGCLTVVAWLTFSALAGMQWWVHSALS